MELKTGAFREFHRSESNSQDNAKSIVKALRHVFVRAPSFYTSR